MIRDSLTAVPVRYWDTAGLRLELWTLENINSAPAPIEESASGKRMSRLLA